MSSSPLKEKIAQLTAVGYGRVAALDARSYAAAVDLAETAHAQQRKDYGVYPYSHHLRMVRDVLSGVGYQDETSTAHAAWLHDALEDTGLTYRNVYDCFGGDVADLVEAVTGRGRMRSDRCKNAYEKIQNMPGAVILKLADRIANVRFSKENSEIKFAMYKREWPGFKRALRGPGVLGKAELKLWELLEAEMRPSPQSK